MPKILYDPNDGRAQMIRLLLKQKGTDFEHPGQKDVPTWAELKK